MGSRVSTPACTSLLLSCPQISNLIASEIIRQEDVSVRASAIEKWVAVADICRCLHNYNAVLEITSSMNRSAIFRLKKTWLKVSKQVWGPSGQGPQPPPALLQVLSLVPSAMGTPGWYHKGAPLTLVFWREKSVGVRALSSSCQGAKTHGKAGVETPLSWGEGVDSSEDEEKCVICTLGLVWGHPVALGHQSSSVSLLLEPTSVLCPFDRRPMKELWGKEALGRHESVALLER